LPSRRAEVFRKGGVLESAGADVASRRDEAEELEVCRESRTAEVLGTHDALARGERDLEQERGQFCAGKPGSGKLPDEGAERFVRIDRVATAGSCRIALAITKLQTTPNMSEQEGTPP
jgi:hypothetical protein